MNEKEAIEVEKVLLHISDARSRARKAVEACAKSGADAHVVAALKAAEDDLDQLHRRLSQGTYYADADKPLQLVV
jgi:cellobiose-specific phosphotransferase system component IIA